MRLTFPRHFVEGLARFAPRRPPSSSDAYARRAGTVVFVDDPAEVLSSSRTIAVVGASGTPGTAAHDVPVALIAAGWDVVPVNPTRAELYGRRCYPDLAAIGHPVDLVDVFRPSAEAAGVARAAVAAGAKALWLQLGITSTEAARIAADAGLAYVEDTCAGVVSRRPGVAPPS